MLTVILQLLGVLVFVAGTVLLRRWVLHSPTQRTTNIASRLGHALFHACLFWPYLATGFRPGFDRVDALVGLRPLPWPSLFRGAGLGLLTAGLGLALASFWRLGAEGKGAPSFLLVKRVVTDGLYNRVRNPLALGWYLFCVGLGGITGSSYLTLLALLGYIPAHIFFLKHFEELELEIRFGEPYRRYKESVPFLLPRLRARPNAKG